MPCVREIGSGFYGLYYDLHSYVLIPGKGELATDRLSRHKWSIHVDQKPFAKLTGVGERLPDAVNRGRQFDALLDSILCRAIFHKEQPPGCISQDYMAIAKEMQPYGCA